MTIHSGPVFECKAISLCLSIFLAYNLRGSGLTISFSQLDRIYSFILQMWKKIKMVGQWLDSKNILAKCGLFIRYPTNWRDI